MISLEPVMLEGYGVRLDPLAPTHAGGLAAAATDGRLWELRYTFVPEPDQADRYIAAALAGQEAGHMLPWVVRLASSGEIIGSTRYHDIVREVDRVEIGYTWYAARYQRSFVNTACKLLLFAHGFDTLGCRVVGLRTDILNTRSQQAIEALGAHRDGIIRHDQLRRDGTVRDTVRYSVLVEEWPTVRQILEARRARHPD
jgi:RimJ/RimL family protein N-acetyltransferase